MLIIQIAATWKQDWEASGPIRVHRHVSVPGEGVKGKDLSRKQWTTLNRLQTGVGRYRASMKKWGLADSATCECGEPEQTADHIINSCPLHRPPSHFDGGWHVCQAVFPEPQSAAACRRVERRDCAHEALPRLQSASSWLVMEQLVSGVCCLSCAFHAAGLRFV